ncbi:MAG: dihydroneopterin aldolase, partial [Candidatus Limnocylindrales bacterium]
ANMRFDGRHGVEDDERARPQPFEVDLEIGLDLRAAGLSDDLGRTVDYGDLFEICRSVVEGPSRRLIESLAEAIAGQVLDRTVDRGVEEVVVRVRKPQAPLPGRLDHAAVEITRRRADEGGK